MSSFRSYCPLLKEVRPGTPARQDLEAEITDTLALLACSQVSVSSLSHTTQAHLPGMRPPSPTLSFSNQENAHRHAHRPI